MGKAKVKASPVRMNRKTANSVLAGGFGVSAMLNADAERVAAAARNLAPSQSAETPHSRGRYRDSIGIRASTRRESRGVTRLVVQVVAPVAHARRVERRFSVMARALAASRGRRGGVR